MWLDSSLPLAYPDWSIKMNGVWLLAVINSLCVLVILYQVTCFRQVTYNLSVLRKSGIAVDWYRLFPGFQKFRPVYKWLLYYSDELDKTYLSKEDKVVFHLLWTFFMPFMIVVCYFRGYFSFLNCVIICAGIYFGKRVLLTSYKKKRTHNFNKNASRLYMFLHNQLSAGIQPKDCVISLHKVVSEPILQERLKAFGSLYVQTLNFNLAFEEISAYYDGTDVDAFKIAIEQGLVIGENLESLKKQEALMFSKYMNYLQLETERQKVKTLVVVTLFCIIIIVMIGLPLAMELDQAINTIFV
jgi:hypothetical protein